MKLLTRMDSSILTRYLKVVVDQEAASRMVFLTSRSDSWHRHRLRIFPKADPEMDNGVMFAKRSARESAACSFWKFNLPPVISVRQLKEKVLCFGAAEHPRISTTAAKYHDGD